MATRASSIKCMISVIVVWLSLGIQTAAGVLPVSQNKTVQLVMQPNASHIPVCRMHDSMIMMFTFLVHCEYMQDVHSKYDIDIKLKFQTTRYTGENQGALETIQYSTKVEKLGCDPIELKRPGDPMLRIQCYMWNVLRKDDVMVQDYVVSASYQNRTVWEYKEPLKPINYVYYCFPEHSVQIGRADRYYDNSRIDLEWTPRYYDTDIKHLHLKHTVSVRGDAHEENYTIPQDQCEKEYGTCKKTIKNLNPCEKLTVYIDTEFLGMNSSYQPPTQRKRKVFNELFRNCSASGQKSRGWDRGARLNTTQTVVLSVLVTLTVLILAVALVLVRRRVLNRRNHIYTTPREGITCKTHGKVPTTTTNNNCEKDVLPNHYEEVLQYTHKQKQKDDDLNREPQDNDFKHSDILSASHNNKKAVSLYATSNDDYTACSPSYDADMNAYSASKTLVLKL